MLNAAKERNSLCIDIANEMENLERTMQSYRDSYTAQQEELQRLREAHEFEVTKENETLSRLMAIFEDKTIVLLNVIWMLTDNSKNTDKLANNKELFDLLIDIIKCERNNTILAAALSIVGNLCSSKIIREQKGVAFADLIYTNGDDSVKSALSVVICNLCLDDELALKLLIDGVLEVLESLIEVNPKTCYASRIITRLFRVADERGVAMDYANEFLPLVRHKNYRGPIRGDVEKLSF